MAFFLFSRKKFAAMDINKADLHAPVSPQVQLAGFFPMATCRVVVVIAMHRQAERLIESFQRSALMKLQRVALQTVFFFGLIVAIKADIE